MDRSIAFFCKCFGEIDQTIDLLYLQEQLKRNFYETSVEIMNSLCLEEDLKKVASIIKESVEKKVLIAACSPLARGDIVLSGLAQEGINLGDIELVDIREGCAWIHREDPQGANQKAWNLVNMGLTSLEYRGTSEDLSVEVCQEALIIGAGPAGLSSAVSLAKLGFSVHLLEKLENPGGMLKLISRLFPDEESGPEKLRPYIREVEGNPSIKFYPLSRVLSIEGSAGNFKIDFSSRNEAFQLTAGVIIVACGSRPIIPNGLYKYGELRDVITQMELELRLDKGLIQAKRAVFIQCVAARDKERPYCSTICCPASLKNGMRILDEVPDSEVFVLHRDVMTPGRTLEEYYRKALSTGVRFIRYDERTPPEILGSHRVKAVEVWDTTSGIRRRIDADVVVLSTPLFPPVENRKLAGMLGVKLDRHGFFSGNDPMHPLESTMDGVFTIGSARWPVSAQQAIAQGEAAAIKAASFLKGSKIAASSLGLLPVPRFLRAHVNPTACSGCGACIEVCPFKACQLYKEGDAYISKVNPMKCKGCGSCVAVCPNGAIQIPEQNSYSVAEMLKISFQEDRSLSEGKAEGRSSQRDNESPKVVVFACRWCGMIGADGAGKRRIPLPSQFRVIPVECAARIEAHWVFRALSSGIDGVLVIGCHLGGCRYGDANYLIARRLELLKSFLDTVGMGGNRLLINWGTAHEPHQFAELVTEFLDELSTVRPSPFKINPYVA